MLKEDRYHHRRIKELHGVAKLLLNRPILKFIIFTIIQFILINFSSLFPTTFPIRFIIDFLGILISIYFVLIIIYVIKNSINRLANPQNLLSLILTYALFILGILLLFSTIYSVVEISRLGYIKYGTCTDKFTPSLIDTDKDISRNFLYFSAMTFFTVGYGDICPMGFARIVSIFAAFAGHLISVVIVALIINNYLRKKENK
jgi:potassium channel LctB